MAGGDAGRPRHPRAIQEDWRPGDGPAARFGKEEAGMMTLVTGIVGIALFVAFLGTLLWWIRELPFTLIVVGVTLLMLREFVQSLRPNDAGR
jgi:hypothetical protein